MILYRPDRAAQGSEDGQIVLFRSISERGEDVARDIKTRLRERRSQIMSQTARLEIEHRPELGSLFRAGTSENISPQILK
jgi:hypothetical protein